MEHRVAQRLLSRFTSQGLVHHDLSKACLVHSEVGGNRRVILIGRLSVYGPGASRLHEEIIPVTAQWTESELRNGPLTPYGSTGEQTTLERLREALDRAGRDTIADQVVQQFHGSAQTDIADLLPHLEHQANQRLQQAQAMLAQRASAESESMVQLLESQWERIKAAQGGEGFQMPLDFDEAEVRQYEADRRAWERRLEAIETELKTEPARIADSYSVRAHRVDPIGLVYLLPRTG